MGRISKNNEELIEILEIEKNFIFKNNQEREECRLFLKKESYSRFFSIFKSFFISHEFLTKTIDKEKNINDYGIFPSLYFKNQETKKHKYYKNNKFSNLKKLNIDDELINNFFEKK